MNTIYFVTQNEYKFKKFKSELKSDNFDIKQLARETPEIQASDNLSVALFSAKWASNESHKPVICEDVGVYIDSLGGFPGPYLSQCEKWLKTEGFLKLLEGEENRNAKWEYSIAFCYPSEEPVGFNTYQEGKISKEPRGESGWYMDKIFVPGDQEKTTAQLLDQDEYVRNQNHYKQLIEYLENRKR